MFFVAFASFIYGKFALGIEQCVLFILCTDICGVEWRILSTNQIINLTSPRYPDLYPVNLDCRWGFESPHTGDIRLRFLVFRISPWLYEQALEYLDVGIGEMVNSSSRIIRLQGDLYPQSLIVANASIIWIAFQSSSTINHDNIGFRMEIIFNNGQG